MLLILDGWGWREEPTDNAVRLGTHAKLVHAFDFQRIGSPIEHRRDFSILYRYRHEP